MIKIKDFETAKGYTEWKEKKRERVRKFPPGVRSKSMLDCFMESCPPPSPLLTLHYTNTTNHTPSFFYTDTPLPRLSSFYKSPPSSLSLTPP